MKLMTFSLKRIAYKSGSYAETSTFCKILTPYFIPFSSFLLISHS